MRKQFLIGLAVTAATGVTAFADVATTTLWTSPCAFVTRGRQKSVRRSYKTTPRVWSSTDAISKTAI